MKISISSRNGVGTPNTLVVLTLALLQTLSSLVVSKDTATTTDFVPWHDEKYPLIDWVRSKQGGFVSEKIEIRKRPLSSDVRQQESGPQEFGVFATDNIEKDEILLVLPPDAYIESNDEKSDEEEDDYYFNLCREVAIMVREYQNKSSEYYTYASFVLDEDSPAALRNRQPAFWSEEARHLLFHEMIDDFLGPTEEESEFRDDCGFYTSSSVFASPEIRKLHEDAFTYYLSTASGNILFPIYDMMSHRGGRWRNVAILRRALDDMVVVMAYRDIFKGEQLHKSFNRCDYEDGDCDDWDEAFVTTQDLFRGTGVVSNYPRRWFINPQPSNLRHIVVYDVDEEDDGTMTLTWKTPVPTLFALNFILAHLKELQRRDEEFRRKAAALDSSFEHDAILKLLEAYKEALHLAWLHRTNNPLIDSEAFELDSFEKPKGLGTNMEDYFMCYVDKDCMGQDFDNIYMDSMYQTMKFKHCYATEDSCLTLTNIIQSCTSFRPHYHESFVHIPAQYAKEMKRVAFLGGGDNLLLYEIFKYPELELVVGMELDQTVPRYSFKHFGTSPYFHDPRMQWWFGDASKSFLALPKEYFGSFDLVIVDLLSFIADSLNVTDSLTLMDAASLLIKPDGGVIVKQEDFSVTMVEDKFAKYTVHMLFMDLPMLCEQTIVMGSNSIDFLTAPRYAHGINTFVRDDYLVHSSFGESVWEYPAWNEYYHRADNMCKAHKPEEREQENPLISSAKISQVGVLLIVEAEKLTFSDSIEDCQATIRSIVKQHGLREVNISKHAGTFEGRHFLLPLEEGYVMARTFFKENYIGFDLMLWDQVEILDEIKDTLISAFGGSLNESITSFRIVAAGMKGKGDGVCRKEELKTVASEIDTCTAERVASSEDPCDVMELEQIVVKEFLSTMLKGQEHSIVAVLCGEHNRACLTMDVVSSVVSDTHVLLPINSCESGVDAWTCAKEIRIRLSNAVKDKTKIGVILVDKAASIQTCKTIHRVLSHSVDYDAFLNDNNAVIVPVPVGEDWRSIFIDRFRTELGSFFDPSHRADVRFNNGTTGKQSEWRVYAAGRKDFFSLLARSLANIEKETNWGYTVDRVVNGGKRFIVQPDVSTRMRNKDYDKTNAIMQWKTQHPVGYQSVIQMEQPPSQKPLENGERVLVRTLDDGPWDKMYEPAFIIDVNEDSSSAHVKFEIPLDESKDIGKVKRDRIIRISTHQEVAPEHWVVGDIVLFEEKDGYFFTCMVSAKHGDTYDLAKVGLNGEKYFNVAGSRLMRETESTEFFEDAPPLTLSKLMIAFKKALLHLKPVESAEEKGELPPRSIVVGDGAIAFASWSTGNAIMKWDGGSRVDMNLFMGAENRQDRDEFQRVFLSSMGSMTIAAMDEFPRGYGQLVNFASHLRTLPAWMSEPPASGFSPHGRWP